MSASRIENPVFRSCLYVPGHQARLVQRAYESEADAVIIDLEDAVPGTEKPRARQTASRVTASVPPKPTYVRVNSMASGRGEDDVRAIAGPGLSGVRLAKVGCPGDVKRVELLLAQAGCPASIHLLIETAYALETAFALATSSPAVAMLSLGEYDLCADLRVATEGPVMDACRSRAVIASRAAGLRSPSQSVYQDIRDTDGLLRTSRHGKSLGFMGRMAVHPLQIPAIHEAYTPTSEEIANAQSIFSFSELAGGENQSVAVADDGRIISPPILANAKNVLQLASALNLVEESA